MKIIIISIFPFSFITTLSWDINLTVTRICCNQIPLLTPVVKSPLRHRRLPEVVLCYWCIKALIREWLRRVRIQGYRSQQPTTESVIRVNMNLFTKMMYNENNFHLVHNRISPAVVAVVATIASIQFFFPGPILDLLIPTDRLVQHLAQTHNLDAHTSMTTG